MIDIRPICEHCATPLPPDSDEARICSFTCTFCRDCVEKLLQNVCPNCGGGFEKRPIRPANHLKNHPANTEPLNKPVDLESFQSLLNRFSQVDPRHR